MLSLRNKRVVIGLVLALFFYLNTSPVQLAPGLVALSRDRDIRITQINPCLATSVCSIQARVLANAPEVLVEPVKFFGITKARALVLKATVVNRRVNNKSPPENWFA